eukprot:7195804-Pyramimonas_sp.AAC.1
MAHSLAGRVGFLRRVLDVCEQRPRRVQIQVVHGEASSGDQVGHLGVRRGDHSHVSAAPLGAT